MPGWGSGEADASRSLGDQPAPGTALGIRGLHPQSVRPAVSRQESREAQDPAPPPNLSELSAALVSRTWAPGPLGVPHAPARLRLFSGQSGAAPPLVGFPGLPVSTRHPPRH